MSYLMPDFEDMNAPASHPGMNIVDVSIVGNLGVQVCVQCLCSSNANHRRQVKLGDPEWPRLRAFSRQIAQVVPAVNGLVLDCVDQRVSDFIYVAQFSFVTIPT